MYDCLFASQGVAGIVASWVLSPVFSGIIAVFLFLTVRTFVLRSEKSVSRALIAFPILVTATIAVNGKLHQALFCLSRSLSSSLFLSLSLSLLLRVHDLCILPSVEPSLKNPPLTLLAPA